MYQKEIIYMGLYKDGSRLGSAGFLKVESKDRESGLYLKIKNIPHSINGRFPVRFYNGTGWKEVDGITLQEGNGIWEEWEPAFLRQIRLQIILPGGYLIEGIGKEAQSGLDGRQRSETITDSKGISLQEQRISEKGSIPEEEKISENERTPEQERVSGRERTLEEEGTSEQKRTSENGADEKTRSSNEFVERIPVQKKSRSSQNAVSASPVMVSEELPAPMADEMQIENIKEDKWEQILATYQQIHPYGDERVYVKLEPKDFIILQAKYQNLVNNSFLLHGFYNYRYVILGKENDYYLGVPGVFYEREKMVALMFGFEAFECSNGEARPGEFGYYLRKVEI